MIKSSTGNWLILRLKSFQYAWSGIRELVAGQMNARIHLVATVMVVTFGLCVNLDRMDWVALAIVIGLVWVAEAMNTALEYLADASIPEHNELVGKAKDLSAGAVLLAAVTATIVGALIFWPHLPHQIQG